MINFGVSSCSSYPSSSAAEDSLNPAKRQRLGSRTAPSSLSLVQSEQIIDSIFRDELTAARTLKASSLQGRINHLLESEQTAIRLHKNADDFSLWFFKNQDGFTLTFIGERLGEGGAKIIKKAVKVSVAEERIEFSDVVIKRSKNPALIESICRDGLKHQRELFNQIEDAANFFVSLPNFDATYEGKKGAKLESEYPRYAGDLSQTMQDWALLTENEFISMTPIQFMHGFSHLLLGIEKMHAINKIHLDMRPKNILVKFDNNQPIFHLDDFDTMTNIDSTGFQENVHKRREYHYSNYSAQQGYATKMSDLYTIALVMAESLITKLNSYVSEAGHFRADVQRNYSDLLYKRGHYHEQFRFYQLEYMDRLFPDAGDLFDPFEDVTGSVEPEDVIALLNFANNLHNPTQASIIKKFAIGMLIEKDLFELLRKFVDHDFEIREIVQQNKNNCEESHTTFSFTEAWTEGFRQYPFPSLEEIQAFLQDCMAKIELLDAN